MNLVAQAAADRHARRDLPLVVDERAERGLSQVALRRAERSGRAVEAAKEQADERIDVAEGAAADLQRGPRAIAETVVPGQVPAAAHLDRVLPLRMRQRRRDTP